MYCTTTDIVNDLTSTVVAQLSSDGTPISINTTLIDKYITSASELIDGYLRGRYTLPLTNDSEIIKGICENIVSYELHSRRRGKAGNIPESITNIYNRAMEMLTKIQKGEILLNETTTPSYMFASSRTRLFSETLLKNYNDIGTTTLVY